MEDGYISGIFIMHIFISKLFLFLVCKIVIENQGLEYNETCKKVIIKNKFLLVKFKLMEFQKSNCVRN